MASVRKRGNSWRAQVSVNKVRDTGTFPTKAQAQAWAAERETELRAAKSGVVVRKQVRDAFNRYELEISRHKRGHRWEALRLMALAEIEIEVDEQKIKFGDIWLPDLRTPHIAALRDVRLKSVKASTVNRDMNLVSHVFSTARREWHWIHESPTKDVRRPKDPPPRDRRPTEDEIARLRIALGFDQDDQATKKGAIVAVAYLFAIETAMRAGEICKLRPEHVNGRVARLPAAITKNGRKRDVPLSKRAQELLTFLPEPEEGGTVFGVDTDTIDSLFRKAKTRCQIENLTFHDSRHEAITRLAKKLDVLALARMVGHTDLRMLQVYYNETAEEMAGRLD